MSSANDALRRARRQRPSDRLPGCPTSRSELAELVVTWLHRETGEVFALDERAIGRWERGTVRLPSAHYRAALRSVLAVDHDWEVGFGDAPRDRDQRVDAGGDPPSVDAIRSMAASVHAADRRCGGGSLYQSVVDYLQTDVAKALFGPTSGAHVFAAAASLTEVAGWMAHDSGRDVDARMHFAGSYRLSLAAGSVTLAANMCASMSHLAAQNGQFDDALRLAEAGLARLGDTEGAARVSARLHAMHAKACALRGERQSCLRELALAERSIDGDNDDEHASWTAYFDEGSLAAESAAALHLLGDLAAAERNARVVLDLRRGDRVRALAFGRLSLASILLAADRTDEAAELGIQVLGVAPTLASMRVRAQLGELAMAVRVRPSTTTTLSFYDGMAALSAGGTAQVPAAWPV